MDVVGIDMYFCVEVCVWIVVQLCLGGYGGIECCFFGVVWGVGDLVECDLVGCDYVGVGVGFDGYVV